MYFPLEMRKDTFYFCFNVAIWGLHRRKNECGSVKIQEKNGFFETSFLSSHVSSCPSIVFLQHLFTQNIPLNRSESISMQTVFHPCR